MSSGFNNLREIENFRLDPAKKVLYFRENLLDIPLKEIELLCVLTENAGELVTKEELLENVWKDSFVEESNLSRHVYRLRKMFENCGETATAKSSRPKRPELFNRPKPTNCRSRWKLRQKSAEIIEK